MELTIKKHMRSKDDDGLNDYIESLENYILGLKASNTNRLIFKLDEINGLIADDLEMIITGEDTGVAYEDIGNLDVPFEASNLRVLSDSKDSKTFERIMVLYTKLKDFQGVANAVASMIPEVEPEKKADEKVSVNVKPPKGRNAFEAIQEQLKTTGK